MLRLKSSKIIVLVGCGVLLAAALACGAGGGTSSGGGGGAVTSPPATQASDSSSASDPLETMDPCSIVTQDDATAFFGAPSVAGMPGSKGSPTFCIYATADQTGHLSFNVRYIAGGAVGSEDFTSEKAGYPDVPGLGDGAFWAEGISQLDVARGPWAFSVSGTINAKPPTLDQLKVVAQTALSRLP